MMTSIEIIKGKGIEGLAHRCEAEEERRQTAEAIGLDMTLYVYELFLEKKAEMWNSRGEAKAVQQLEGVVEVLPPEGIDQFLQRSVDHEDHENYTSHTALFISKLIQNSYESGHNGFVLSMGTIKPLTYLGYRINGGWKPVDIVVKGDVGSLFGSRAENARFHITGDADELVGNKSYRSSFRVDGEVGDSAGNEAYRSVFLSPDARTARKMLLDAHPSCGGTVIHPNRTEVLRKPYSAFKEWKERRKRSKR